MEKIKYEKALDEACKLIGNIILEEGCFGDFLCPTWEHCMRRFYCIEAETWKEYFLRKVQEND